MGKIKNTYTELSRKNILYKIYFKKIKKKAESEKDMELIQILKDLELLIRTTSKL